MTNPIRFDKIMDNLYFTLSTVSKKAIQQLIKNFITTKEANSFEEQLLINIVTTYPIVVPILVNTKIQTNKFIQHLIERENSYPLLKAILNCSALRYRSGENYITEEIVPLIITQCIKRITSKTATLETYRILLQSLLVANISLLTTDLIQPLINLIDENIVASKDMKEILSYSEINYEFIKLYLRKKAHEMKKDPQNFEKIYQNIIWNEFRQFVNQ